jgi:hypothetical protein
MAKKLIIHAGHGKTGTSAFQSNILRIQADMAAVGLHYPVSHLTDKLVRRARDGGISSGNLQLRHSNDLGEFADSILQAGEASQASSVIFSNEILWRKILVDSLFRERLIKWNQSYDLRLILVTRDIFEHLFSSYHQSLKRSGCSQTFPQYLKSTGYKSVAIQFSRLLELLDDLGIEYKLLNYSVHRENISRTILDECGAKALDMKPPTQKECAVVNRSLTKSEAQLMTAINRLIKEFDLRGVKPSVLTNKIISKSPSLRPMKLYLTTEEAELIRDVNLSSIEKINRRLPDDHALSCVPSAGAIGDVQFDTYNQEVESLRLAVELLLRQLSILEG